jgi:hypothetical protein
MTRSCKSFRCNTGYSPGNKPKRLILRLLTSRNNLHLFRAGFGLFRETFPMRNEEASRRFLGNRESRRTSPRRPVAASAPGKNLAPYSICYATSLDGFATRPN